jgi:hypothetical protein
MPVLVLLCLAAASTGCGGDDGSDTTTTRPAPATTPPGGANGDQGTTGATGGGGTTAGRGTTDTTATAPAAKRRVIKQADRRCRDRSAAQERVERKFDQVLERLDAQQVPQAARAAGQAIEVIQSERRELERVHVAPPDRPKLARLLQTYDERVTILTSIRLALLRRDVARLLPLTRRAEALKLRQRAAAKEFGFRVCGVTKVRPGGR